MEIKEKDLKKALAFLFKSKFGYLPEQLKHYNDFDPVKERVKLILLYYFYHQKKLPSHLQSLMEMIQDD